MTFDLYLIVASFLLVFFAELGDKTQIVAFSLSSSAKNPFVIFLASSLALICSNILASLLGVFLSLFFQEITRYISIVLFLSFGFYLILSKEPPYIKDCFLKTIAFENMILKRTAKFFKRNKVFVLEIRNIFKEETGHIELFKMLLKHKKLFKDDINQEKAELEKIKERFIFPPKLKKLKDSQFLEAIIKAEEAVRDMYNYFYLHLCLEHHKQDNLADLVKNLIEEEERHLVFFKKILNNSL